jgi:UDP-N-acetyl-2-amino-2-deoxyglucuronate dehydrogenase
VAEYKVAIIACGQIARAHANGWQRVPNTKIWCIADTNADAITEFGNHYGVPAERRYTDFREMLDKERPDFVSVCSWHVQHAEMTIAACSRKPMAVICDKPMATSLGEADEMMIAARRERVKLAIGHQRRFHAVWAECARLIKAGTIGTPMRASVNAGTGLLNNATHSIDLMRFVTGDPKAEWVMGNVQRLSDRLERSIPCEELALGAVGFDNGMVGTILSGMPFKERQPWLQVFGSDGTIEMSLRQGDPTKRTLRDDGAMRVSENNPSAHYNDEESAGRYFISTSGGWKPVDVPWQDPFEGEMRELVEWVEGKVPDHRGSAAQARQTVEIMMAIYESARCHELVKLPLETRSNPLQLMVEEGDLPVLRPGAYETRATLVRGEGMSWYR